MDKRYLELIEEAKKAIDKGFYANKKPQKCYGAAVLVESGNIYSAGQYSSFNHITSIHAEMGAVLCATMANEQNIEALALAVCEEASIEAKSCGICLQFLKEHSQRINRDIVIIYVSNKNESHKIKKLSELTKEFW